MFHSWSHPEQHKRKIEQTATYPDSLLQSNFLVSWHDIEMHVLNPSFSISIAGFPSPP